MFRLFTYCALLFTVSLSGAGCGAPGTAVPQAGSTPTARQPASADTAATTTPVADGPTAVPTAGQTVEPTSVTRARLSEVTLALGFIPSVQFAPFYVAAQKGYYKQEGLNVRFQHGIEQDLLKLVGAGKLNYAVASGDEMLLARSQGVPLVYVGAYFQKYPVVLITPKKAGITKVDQIKGRSVGVPGPYGATYTGMKALLLSSGLSEKDVSVRSIGFTQVQALQRGQVDAVMGYANNEPLQLEGLGMRVNTIGVWQHANLVSNGIITNEQSLAANHEEVAALVRATMRGLEYTIAHPEAAFEASLKYAPEAGGENRSTQMAVLKASIPLWQSEAAKQHGAGYTDPAAWEATRDFLKRSGSLNGDVDPKQAYTNEFIQRAPR